MLHNSSLFKEIDKDCMKLYCKVIYIIGHITSLPKNKTKGIPFFECHSISRVISMLIPDLKCIDGSYVGLLKNDPNHRYKFQPVLCNHSWLVTPQGAIIDPYPVGLIALNAILVVSSGEYQPYGSGKYIEEKEKTKNFITRSVLWRATRIYNIVKDGVDLNTA